MENVHLPSSILELQETIDVLNVVVREHPGLRCAEAAARQWMRMLLTAARAAPSLACFSLLYLLKQAFVIPGSLLLNITAGALMGTLHGACGSPGAAL